MTAAVPPWLIGAWRRKSIAWPDGGRDETTWVLWLQAGTAFADIRLPAGGAAAEGFAGHISLDGDICTWHRQVDINPPGVADVGRLALCSADLMVEDGVLQPYREVWCRDGRTGPLLVLRRPGALLVRVGDHVLRATAQAVDYWPAGAAAITRSTAADRIGTPLGFGGEGGMVVESGTFRWRVVESTAADPLTLLTGEGP